MVGRLTLGKEGFEDVEERMRSIVGTADEEREAFLALADEDASAFEAVMASFRLPKATDEEQARGRWRSRRRTRGPRRSRSGWRSERSG